MEHIYQIARTNKLAENFIVETVKHAQSLPVGLTAAAALCYQSMDHGKNQCCWYGERRITEETHQFGLTFILLHTRVSRGVCVCVLHFC